MVFPCFSMFFWFFLWFSVLFAMFHWVFPSLLEDFWLLLGLFLVLVLKNTFGPYKFTPVSDCFDCLHYFFLVS